MAKPRITLAILLTLALPCAAAAQRLSVEPQVNHEGGDYTKFRTTQHEECRQACARDSRCQAYTFNSIDSMCYLKDRVTGARSDSRVVSGVKEGYGGGYRPDRPGNDGYRPGGGLSEERGIDYRGGDYTDFRARDLDDCKSECRRDRRCVAYTFKYSNRACYLKDRVGDRQRDGDKVSGIRGDRGDRGDRPGYGGGDLTQEYGLDYAGNDYEEFRARSADSCREECRRDRRCAAYTFNTRSGLCYLKDRVGPPRRDGDKVTGFKRN